MNTHQELIIRTLEAVKGDDLARAEHTFRGYTHEQMLQSYGYGETPLEILQAHQNRNARVDAAIAWVKAR